MSDGVGAGRVRTGEDMSDNGNVNFIVLAALGLLGLLAATQPLRSSRPLLEPGAIDVADERVPATAWEDPLEAILTHQRSRDADGSTAPNAAPAPRTLDEFDTVLTQNDAPAPGWGRDRGPLLLIGFLDDYPDATSADARREARAAVRAALSESGYARHPPFDKRYFRYIDTTSLREDRMAATLWSLSRSLLLDEFMWLVERHAPRRFRERGVFSMILSRVRQLEERDAAFSALRACRFIPYSTFRNPDAGPREHEYVVLLWLWAERVRNDRMHDVVAQLATRMSFRDTRVIGPPDSEGLTGIVTDIDRSWRPRFTNADRRLRYVSPYSTRDPAEFFPHSVRGRPDRPFAPWVSIADPGVSVQRVIASDDEAIEGLLYEFASRSPPSASGTFVVISPLGLDYAEAMSESIDAAAAIEDVDYGDTTATNADGAARSDDGNFALRDIDVVQYNYFPQIRDDVQSKRRDEQPTAERGDDAGATMFRSLLGGAEQRPVGESQLDYVERLVERIEHDNRTWRRQGKPVRAVLLAGGDTYDKLTILRALDGRLPGALRMTTDYYALYAHRDEQRWTRGMLIGSAFGGTLPRKLQGSTPPFRNSYQAAVFLAARAAVDMRVHATLRSIDAENSRLSSIFEVSRDGLLDLGPSEADPRAAPLIERTINRSARVSVSQSVKLTMLVALIAIIVAGLAGLPNGATNDPHDTRNRAAGAGIRRVARAGIATFLVSMLLFVGYVLVGRLSLLPGEERFAWSSGVSAWPGVLLRTAAVAIAFHLMTRLLQTLAHADRTVCELLSHKSRPRGAADPRDAVINTISSIDRITLDASPIIALGYALVYLVSITAIAALAIAVLIGISLVTSNPAVVVGLTLPIYLVLLVLGWLGVGALARLLVSLTDERGRPRERLKLILTGTRRPLLRASLRFGMPPLSDAEAVVDGRAIWREFLERSRPWSRFVRAAAAFLLFTAILVVIMLLDPPMTQSVRGHLSQLLFGATWLAALAVIFFFIFLVLDECILTRALIARLVPGRGRVADWGRQLPSAAIEQIGDVDGDTRNVWITMCVIGELTNDALKTTLFPAYLFALLLLSISSVFEPMVWSTTVVAMIAIGGLAALASAILLRHAATDAKRAMLASLPADAEGRHDDRVRTVLENYDIGAFGSLVNTPILRAGLIPFTGVGAFELIRLFFGV